MFMFRSTVFLPSVSIKGKLLSPTFSLYRSFFLAFVGQCEVRVRIKKWLLKKKVRQHVFSYHKSPHLDDLDAKQALANGSHARRSLGLLVTIATR